MSAAASERRRVFVERQFALQHARGAGSIAAAAETLRRALPDNCRGEVDRLEAELSGKATPLTPGREPEVALVAAARERGGAPLAAYASLRSLRAQGQQALDGLLIGVGGQVQYLIVLLLVLVVVAGMYSGFVYPALARVYESFGVLGMGVTEYLFGRARLVWLLILIAIVLVLGARWLFARIHRRLAAGETLEARLASWPILGAVVRSQRRWLALQWMAALVDAGVARAAAHAAATARYGSMSDPDGGVLEGAEALGTLREELLAQIELEQAEVLRAATRARQWVVYTLRFIVYWIIAIAVIGMYAPIFGLGSLT
jgi:hypothetical protein